MVGAVVGSVVGRGVEMVVGAGVLVILGKRDDSGEEIWLGIGITFDTQEVALFKNVFS